MCYQPVKTLLGGAISIRIFVWNCFFLNLAFVIAFISLRFHHQEKGHFPNWDKHKRRTPKIVLCVMPTALVVNRTVEFQNKATEVKSRPAQITSTVDEALKEQQDADTMESIKKIETYLANIEGLTGRLERLHREALVSLTPKNIYTRIEEVSGDCTEEISKARKAIHSLSERQSGNRLAALHSKRLGQHFLVTVNK